MEMDINSIYMDGIIPLTWIWKWILIAFIWMLWILSTSLTWAHSTTSSGGSLRQNSPRDQHALLQALMFSCKCTLQARVVRFLESAQALKKTHSHLKKLCNFCLQHTVEVWMKSEHSQSVRWQRSQSVRWQRSGMCGWTPLASPC
jgi:hypothetical protein